MLLDWLLFDFFAISSFSIVFRVPPGPAREPNQVEQHIWLVTNDI